ncbi:biopolymer transporter ExbD [bacterium]|nr:biopolymer transporter ExbD [bacterium]
MSNSNRKYTATSRMNITSLVDITMMLLIIFMIASPLMHGKVDLNLPKSRAAHSYEEEATVISISKDRIIYVGKTPMSIDEFASKIKELKEVRNISQVNLKADEGLNYGLIMEVIGYIKEAEIENLGLVAIPEKNK